MQQQEWTYSANVKDCNIVMIRAQGQFENLGRGYAVFDLHRTLVHNQHRTGWNHKKDRYKLKEKWEFQLLIINPHLGNLCNLRPDHLLPSFILKNKIKSLISGMKNSECFGFQNINDFFNDKKVCSAIMERENDHVP